MRINILAGNRELRLIMKEHGTIEECIESYEEVEELLLDNQVLVIGAWIDDPDKPMLTTYRTIN